MKEKAWVGYGVLGCFALAAVTGALYRFGIGYGFTAGLDLANIRHAHSHLMYLGWVTPALFALIALSLPASSGRERWSWVWGVVGATLVAALVAYPLFLAFGYRPVALGAANIPLAAVAAGLNMLVWYVFVGWYIGATRGLPRSRAVVFWDMALAFLVFASFGAWGVSLLKPLGIESLAWASALTHLFLDLFSEGWFVLAVLGLAFAALKPEDSQGGHWSLWLICLGLPTMFALGMPEILVPPGLKMLAKGGSLLVGVGLFVNTLTLWKALPAKGGWLWRVPLMLLFVKVLAQGVVGLWPGIWWSNLHGLRLLYLHLTLLGVVTLGIVAAAQYRQALGFARNIAWFYGAALLVLASLLPLTMIWPEPLRGRWIWIVAAWVALGPPVVALGMLLRKALAAAKK